MRSWPAVAGSVGTVSAGARQAAASGRRLRRLARRSGSDPVAQVGDAALAFQHPGAFQLDTLGCEVVKEPSPPAQHNRDDVQLELVQDTGSQRELRDRGAMDQHILAARRPPGRRIAVLTSSR